MQWISVDERFPSKEKHYRCLCLGFHKSIKCRFVKEKNGVPVRGWIQYSGAHFIHKKRIPCVIAWKELK